MTLKATDKDSAEGTTSRTITVTNVAPTAAINGAPANSIINTPIVLTSTASDVGSADTLTYVWSVVASNGQSITPGTATNFNFTPNAAGTYTINYDPPTCKVRCGTVLLDTALIIIAPCLMMPDCSYCLPTMKPVTL